MKNFKNLLSIFIPILLLGSNSVSNAATYQFDITGGTLDISSLITDYKNDIFNSGLLTLNMSGSANNSLLYSSTDSTKYLYSDPTGSYTARYRTLHYYDTLDSVTVTTQGGSTKSSSDNLNYYSTYSAYEYHPPVQTGVLSYGVWVGGTSYPCNLPNQYKAYGNCYQNNLPTYDIVYTRNQVYGYSGVYSLTVGLNSLDLLRLSTQGLFDYSVVYGSGSSSILGAKVELDITEKLNDSAVPEPATIVLIGLGFAGMGYAHRRKSAQA